VLFALAISAIVFSVAGEMVVNGVPWPLVNVPSMKSP
jgi:hypothetical protein